MIARGLQSILVESSSGMCEVMLLLLGREPGDFIPFSDWVTCRIRIARGIVNRLETAERWRLMLIDCARHDEGSSVAAFQLSPRHHKHNLPDQLRVRPSPDRSGIA